jgi:hypothetical protein
MAEMGMNAAEIVDKIGAGVVAALDTCELFLGVEEFSTRNADIHPEYVTTVMVGRELTGIDRWVSLEARMKILRRDAESTGRLKTKTTQRTSWPAITKAMNQAKYQFGKQRIDVLVREAASDRSPLLVVEAKLGVKNVSGVVKDVNRVVTLFDLYEDAGALGTDSMYGAIVFHVMQEKGTALSLPQKATTMLGKVQARLETLRRAKPKLYFNAGLLTRTLKITQASGYDEQHEDGSVEKVFEKHGYAFQAGLILIGTTADVMKVVF